MESVSLYSEARNEYVKQLATWVVPPLVEFFRNSYDTIAKKEGKRTMAAFQMWCSEVPRWNQDVIDKHVEDLLSSCRCDYVEDLMTAVFIAHTKMLTAIRINSRQKKLQITLPKLDHFLHRIFVECARAFWKAPFLFSDDMPIIERQKNVLQAETMCTEAIGGAVRSLLPIKSILRDNLLEDEEEYTPLPNPKKKKVVESDSESDEESDQEMEVPVASVAPEIPAVPAVHAVPAVPVIPETPTLPTAPTSEINDIPIDETIDVSKEIIEETKEVPMEIKEESKEVPKRQEELAQPAQPAQPVQPVQPVQPAQPAQPPKLQEKPLTVSKEPTPVQLIKDETPAKLQDEFVIDTEPSVRFSAYDVVFDENKPDISEMRYVPKLGLYDDDIPARLHIGGEAAFDDFETVGNSKSEETEDYEMSLNDADFETV